MDRQWFKIILPLIISFAAFSALAAPSDSLQNLLENQLLKKEFSNEEKVIEYLELTSNLYSHSPANALYYVIALEEELNVRNSNIGKAYILSKKVLFIGSKVFMMLL